MALSGCFSSSDETPGQPVTPPETGPQLPQPVAVTAFAPGEVTADIRWADYGVPYITSESLEGVAFGSGYAFARDNACILADQIVRFNSNRSRYFGPDAVLGSGDSMNIISDFAYKGLDIRAIVEEQIDDLSDESRALLQGYTAGYNLFISERPADVPMPCVGQPWVQPIDEVDLMVYAQGVALLPGAANFADGTVPHDKAPQLQRTDFVQNANDSYWLTNPDAPIVGDYLLYGRFNNQQSLRSRMSQLKLTELQDAAEINLEVLEGALLSNRAYLGEAIIDDLVALCSEQGTTPVATANGSVDISGGCNALAQWNGRMDTDSVGALVLREFAQSFSRDPQWEVPFDSADPLNTPHTLARTDATLVHLANAVATIQSAGLDVAAPLGDVQFVERSLPDGTPSGEKLPWGGANNIEGGFNVFARQGAQDGTLLPRHLYATLPGTQLSADAGGYHITSGSSWMFVMQFTEQGPEGRGLLTYSQSSDIASPHYLDQTRYYSSEPRLRPIPFTNDDIDAATIEQRTIRYVDND